MVLIGAIRALTSLLLEVPTGAVGDVYGYKRTMFVGLFALLASTLICAYSNSFAGFLIGTAVSWTLFDSLFSGSFESYVFRVVKEKLDTNEQITYSKVLSNANIAEILGVIGGNLICSALVPFVSYKQIYLLSSLPTILGMIILLLFLPSIVNTEKNNAKSPTIVLRTSFEALKTMFKKKYLRDLMILIVTITMIKLTFLEYSQLFYVQINLPNWLFGYTDAIRHATSVFGIAIAGGVFINSLGIRSTLLLFASVAVLMMILAYSYSPYIVIVLIFCNFILRLADLRFIVRLQELLPNELRASSQSVCSFLGNGIWLLLIGLATLVSSDSLTMLFLLLSLISGGVAVFVGLKVFFSKK